MLGYLKAGCVHDMTRPVAVGERVNAHVIPSVKEPEPDFEAMRRLVAGLDQDQKENLAATDERNA